MVRLSGRVTPKEQSNSANKGIKQPWLGHKDDKGEWQSTNSLDLNEISKIILALSKAYEWVVMKKGKEGVEEDEV